MVHAPCPEAGCVVSARCCCDRDRHASLALVLRDPNANELKAVAPIIVVGAPSRVVAPVTIVVHGERVIGVTSAELLRPHHGAALAIATKLDGSATVPISSWYVGRYSGVGLVELAAPISEGSDVVPLAIGSVNASVNVHGAPAGMVAIKATATGYTRELVGVHVDADDGGGMSDHAIFLASPVEMPDADLAVEGAPVFAWLPPDPVLGRPSELVLFALAYPYRAQIARPRGTPVIAELAGLEDLGKTLIAAVEPVEDARAQLGIVAGEIVGE
jgi:hypothetical protein